MSIAREPTVWDFLPKATSSIPIRFTIQSDQRRAIQALGARKRCGPRAIRTRCLEDSHEPDTAELRNARDSRKDLCLVTILEATSLSEHGVIA
jgi:hypothetical protein